MAEQLTLYNQALRLCKERKLADLTEDREPRHLLDDAWGDGAIAGSARRCLEEGQWTFATKALEIQASASIAPDFGYQYGFDKPDDFVRTTAVCQDEMFNTPLLAYADESEFWFADQEVIYVRIISSDDDYGGNMARWTQLFADFVAADLAYQIVGNLTQSRDIRLEVAKVRDECRLKARSLDAMNKPSVLLPEGRLVQARRGRSRGSRSDGSTGWL